MICFGPDALNGEMSLRSIVRDRDDGVLFNNAHTADATGVDGQRRSLTSLPVEAVVVWSATRKLPPRNLPQVHYRVLKVDF